MIYGAEVIGLPTPISMSYVGVSEAKRILEYEKSCQTRWLAISSRCYAVLVGDPISGERRLCRDLVGMFDIPGLVVVEGLSGDNWILVGRGDYSKYTLLTSFIDKQVIPASELFLT